MKNKKTLLDKMFEVVPGSLALPFGILFISCVLGLFVFPIVFLVNPMAVNGVTIVLFIVCFFVGGLPLIISCFQLTDKQDVKDAFKTFAPSEPPTVQTKDGTVIHCPTCQSTNVVRVSLTSKAVNVYLFGVFGNKRKKQFKCNNCGYMW